MHKNKIKILFVCPYPIGQSPSQRFRFEQYFHLLTEKGYHFEQYSFWSKKAWKILYRNGHFYVKAAELLLGFTKRLFLLFIPIPRADYVFIHREATPIGPPWFEWIVSNVFHKKVIYDFDDAIWLPATSEENSLASQLKWHSKVGAICKWSDVVSCGNEYLGDFARKYNNRVLLNPTTIDTQRLHNPALYTKKNKSDCVTIGWTGTHSTLKYIDLILPVIRSLEKRFPDRLRFVVIADRNPSIPLSSFQFVPWSKETEIGDLFQFDIGIMPLADNVWAKGKCGFKALQYMALGIPTLASPVGVNTIIINDNVNGFLCDTLSKWEEKILKLFEDQEERKRIGVKGRETVQMHYSIDSNCSNFLSLFE